MNDATQKRGEIEAACSAHSEYLLPILFIALGSLFIWQSRDMSQLGSIFPVTIAVVTLLAAVLRLGQLVLHRVRDNTERQKGSTSRRVLLVVAMSAWALIMPWVGFLIAGVAGFFTLMMIAQYQPWTARRLLGHLVTGVVLVAGFYGLFAMLLNVPLPVGKWWIG
ncbi:hypothetical protein L861_14180 [Litchfieldella anticariensis FP35 = DSM 16096]|uniref:DUF1468 domain-containing protein n=1 Tax=Litchfieldella anticariensis (strain DSM 16096 / CECT 5854 / CIP 108499 / LMG 22089 / FP35) TaxID=1121939 RepID=S2KE21_LITA3|nr:tripartite tricarboxylate transporter TctB family protein [Halomonas anticariensis]EPC00417.1 hypothetical protein L861_14180 [Halomonas anticariensis FP35 = DSM 16096]